MDNDVFKMLLLRAALEAAKEGAENNNNTNGKRLQALVSIRKDLQKGIFFTENYNIEKTTGFLLGFLGDDDTNVQIHALECLVTISFNDRQWRAHMIGINCMSILINYVEDSQVAETVLPALMTIQNLLGTGDPGSNVCAKMNIVLQNAYWNRIGTLTTSDTKIKLRLCLVHTIGLLAFRVPLIDKCKTAISDFLSTHTHISINDMNMGPNDVHNMFKTKLDIVRILGYWLISNLSLTPDNDWKRVTDTIKGSTEAAQDWSHANYSQIVRNAIRKLENYSSDLASIISSRVDLPRVDAQSSYPRSNPPRVNTPPRANTPPPSDPPRSNPPKQARDVAISIFLSALQLSRSEADRTFNVTQLMDFYENKVNEATDFYLNNTDEVGRIFPPVVMKSAPAPTPAPAAVPRHQPVKHADSLPPQQNEYRISVKPKLKTNPVGRSDANSTNRTLEDILPKIKTINAAEEFKNRVVIGKGAFGTVYRVEYRNQQVAVKMLKPAGSFGLAHDIDLIKKELSVLKEMRHPRTLTLLHTFKDDNGVYLVSPYYARGSLGDLIFGKTNGNAIVHEREVLDKDSYCVLAADICEGLVYLHNFEPPIIHLDLKPPNILIDDTFGFRAVLADFGISKLKSGSRDTTEVGVVGTYDFMAPEVMNMGEASLKADIYSLAIILYEMIENKRAWAGFTMDHLRLGVVQGRRPGLEGRLSDIIPLKELIETCWHAQPSKRPTSKEAFDTIKRIHQTADWD